MDYSIIIIGAGAVGLACAMESSKRGYKTLLLERRSRFGEETSSRNSEVIHAGIYYPKNSLKAQMCVEGARKLYEWCDTYSVPYKKTGKYIIAINQDDTDNMNSVYEKAKDNGVAGISHIPLSVLNEAEPNIIAYSALYSSETGIIDSHKYMQSLLDFAQVRGCDFAFSHNLIGAEKIPGGYNCLVQTSQGETFEVSSEIVINSAGLSSDEVAALFGINDDSLKLSYCKGNYFKIKSPSKFGIKSLIYPAPEKNYVGLGIHLTVDLDGGIKFGPDATYMDLREQNYFTDENLLDKFYQSAKRYVKNISPEDIYADYSGIRPKLQTPGGEQRDFYIKEETERGLPGLINLIGIESPGLTSSLQIARYVLDLI